LTVTVKLARIVFALLSVAEQRTTVLRPTVKRLPERGWHATATAPSTLSVAASRYLTRTLVALLGARTT